MKNILGLDLGTNSIGWAIRNVETENGNQIINSGAVIFQKGVGEGKSGEFSLAAERRTHRSKRRLYNAKRYRKWATLRVLIANQMCPLTIEELERWTKYKKEEGGRNYPSSPEFMSWLRMDFDGDGKVDYINPYELRCELLETCSERAKNRMHKIGRAFYHLVQRRGFKSSRKSGKSGYANNEELEKLKEAQPNIQIAQVLLNKLNTENKRIRASGVIQRKYFEDEFKAICKKQHLEPTLIEKLHKAIYHVRPLRTQKGLVGKCTLERSIKIKKNGKEVYVKSAKPRIPVSHPLYEEFRALQFVNNLKWRKTDSNDSYEQVPVSVRKEIFKKQFFRVSAPHFKFEEIIEGFSNDGEYEFNYRNKPNVTACPVISRLKAIFKDEWTNLFIEDKDEIGINWSGLSILYTVKYGKKKGKARKLDFEDIWHLLFDYLQTKDKEEELKKFMMDVADWNEKKATAFSEIDVQQGYGSLSKTAITKILPYLRKGYIYSEAVSFANLKNVLGELSFEENKEKATKAISETIAQIDLQKEKLNIVNGLIQSWFGENQTNKPQGVTEKINSQAEKDVAEKLKHYFGEKYWNNFSESKHKEYSDFILKKYLAFLDGKQLPEEKAASRQGKNPDIDYYKLPRLDEAIKDVLKEKFGATDEKLKNLYHPSDIEIYPPAEEIEVVDEETGEVRKCKQLGDPMPPSKGWKNPMAMRTMHELKKMVNYLLETGQVDEDTKIVVEMARELNDANKRWAIQTHQKRREEQNIEFAKVILGLAKEKYPNLKENDADNIDKIRLWWEQLDNGDEIYKQIKTLKEDVQKYRLWREQECRCMYTGKMINLVDLFDGTKTDFEHTLPVSASFDNSLANLTVSDSIYNRKIKIDRIPYDCPNYNSEWKEYSPIKPRLKNWVEKVESLKARIEENKFRTKKTQDIPTKNDYIQKRHLLQFEFDYWNKKVKTFTVEEVPSWWKNSQLVDTQIITKYARAYLKSLFKKVEVQKGSITAEFRKIYGIMGDEKKDRSKHSHHAVDAAVLTLIPGSARREAILKEYYEALERKEKYHQLPYEDFHISHVKDIENKILINHVSKDQTLADTKKKARKRGEIAYLRDGWKGKSGKFILNEKGNKVPMMLQGNPIRGGLHKDKFYGAIKVNERTEDGYTKKENGKYLLLQNKKTKKDEIWIVIRQPIASADIDKIVEPLLRDKIKKQLSEGVKIENVVDFNGKRIRHIRCKVALTHEKVLHIKKHSPSFLSTQQHKQEYLTQNEENYLTLLYEGLNSKKELIRAYRFINLFEMSELKLKNVEQLKGEPEFNVLKKAKGKNILELKLIELIKVGRKVLMLRQPTEKLNDLSNNERTNRIYKVYKFNNSGSDYIFLQHHLEARPNDQLGDGDTLFNPEKYQARLKLTADNFNCLIEGKDFEIKSDGEVNFKV